MDLDLTGGAPFGPLVDRAVTRFEPRAVAVPSTGPVGALTRDAWAAALLFCDGRTAVRVRGVASVLRDAVDLACRLGLARTGRVPVTPEQLDRACRLAGRGVHGGTAVPSEWPVAV